MEVPRLDHHMSSPTSPCEDVIKNLSLEAIQLCDRDGELKALGLNYRDGGLSLAARKMLPTATTAPFSGPLIQN